MIHIYVPRKPKLPNNDYYFLMILLGSHNDRQVLQLFYSTPQDLKNCVIEVASEFNVCGKIHLILTSCYVAVYCTASTYELFFFSVEVA